MTSVKYIALVILNCKIVKAWQHKLLLMNNVFIIIYKSDGNLVINQVKSSQVAF